MESDEGAMRMVERRGPTGEDRHCMVWWRGVRGGEILSLEVHGVLGRLLLFNTATQDVWLDSRRLFCCFLGIAVVCLQVQRPESRHVLFF